MLSYALRPSRDTSTASGCNSSAARTWAASASVPARACNANWYGRVALSKVPAHPLAKARDTRGACRTGVPASAWEALDAIDLQVELRRPVPTLQDVPPFLRAAVKTALLTALTGLREACEQHACQSGVTKSRAWKLFFLNTAHAAGAAGPPRRAGAG